MRLFIAVNFDESERKSLIKSRDMLKDHAVKGKFIRDENFHLTLIFLGETAPDRVPDICKAMNQMPCPGEFSILFHEIGVFKKQGGDIWWIGIEESAELLMIQKALAEELVKSGFSLESRNYNPHLTVGRGVALEEGFTLRELQQNLEPFSARVKRISLMLSEQVEGKLTYTELFGRNLD